MRHDPDYIPLPLGLMVFVCMAAFWAIVAYSLLVYWPHK